MDSISAAIVSAASSQAASQLRSAVATSVLKTALDIQAQSAMALLQATVVSAPAASGGLGQLVDVYA